jgi:hypothetical protein
MHCVTYTRGNAESRSGGVRLGGPKNRHVARKPFEALQFIVGRDGKTYPATAHGHGETQIGVLQAFERGKSAEDIAAAYGVSPWTVRRWRRKWFIRDT